MKNISKILPNTKIVRTLQFKQRWLNVGFVQVSNSLLRNNSVSHGARFLYILLMSRVFRKDFCYPGQKTLGKEIGIADRSVRRLLDTLEKHKWIEVKRRGLNKTNLYFLLKH